MFQETYFLTIPMALDFSSISTFNATSYPSAMIPEPCDLEFRGRKSEWSDTFTRINMTDRLSVSKGVLLNRIFLFSVQGSAPEMHSAHTINCYKVFCGDFFQHMSLFGDGGILSPYEALL